MPWIGNGSLQPIEGLASSIPMPLKVGNILQQQKPWSVVTDNPDDLLVEPSQHRMSETLLPSCL